jgi:adenosylcobinamide-GDP ribazoletransferase
VHSLVTAFKYLTILGRWRAPGRDPAGFGNASLWFPLVGLVIGVVLAAINYLLALHVDSEMLSVVLIALLIVATGATPMAGTKNTFDSMLEPNQLARDGGAEIFGFAAIIIVTLLKVRAIDIMDDNVAAKIFLAPGLARWALVVLLYGYHDRCEETMRPIAENTKLWHLGVTTLITLVLATYLLGRDALWMGLAVSLLALVSRAILHRRHAVLTLNNFGAVTDLGEALTLVLMTVL